MVPTFTEGRGGGRGAISVAMKKTWEKKFAKNCTLFHVVNKAVWADIGAASTSSTNILVLLVLAAPIGEDTQTFYNLKNFTDF